MTVRKLEFGSKGKIFLKRIQIQWKLHLGKKLTFFIVILLVGNDNYTLSLNFIICVLDKGLEESTDVWIEYSTNPDMDDGIR